MLDYDGTLAPFTVARDQAYPYPGIRKRLMRLQDSASSRLVIVSGRPSGELIPLLGIEEIPEIWGLHGAERRLRDGILRLAELPEEAVRGLSEIDIWIERNNLEAYCERKATSRAFHWRSMSESEAGLLQAKIRQLWAGAGNSLALLEFDGGLELKAEGIHKGIPVIQVLKELGEGSAVSYLGDDLTDEDAFSALAGNGLGVLTSQQLRPTRADLWLRPPEELIDFLDRWITATD